LQFGQERLYFANFSKSSEIAGYFLREGSKKENPFHEISSTLNLAFKNTLTGVEILH
jgi:hypothetical protein